MQSIKEYMKSQPMKYARGTTYYLFAETKIETSTNKAIFVKGVWIPRSQAIVTQPCSTLNEVYIAKWIFPQKYREYRKSLISDINGMLEREKKKIEHYKQEINDPFSSISKEQQEEHIGEVKKNIADLKKRRKTEIEILKKITA